MCWQCVVLFAVAIARGLQARSAHAHVTRGHMVAAARILTIVLSASIANRESGRRRPNGGFLLSRTDVFYRSDTLPASDTLAVSLPSALHRGDAARRRSAKKIGYF